ncbi:MAG: type II secretion system F family protein [Rhodospirillales bacterium]|nr:type II secretion system F family protein [Rhodospirillales bacterium]
MARFRYKAVAPTGSIVEGELEAQARAGAIERLRELKHLPVRVEEVTGEEPPPVAPAAFPGPDGRIEPRFDLASPVVRSEPAGESPDHDALVLNTLAPAEAELPPASEPVTEPASEPAVRMEPLIERLSLDAADVMGSMEPILGGAFAPVRDPDDRIEPTVEPGLPAQEAQADRAGDEPEPALEPWLRVAPGPEPILPEPSTPEPILSDQAPEPEAPRPLRWDIGEEMPAASPELPVADATVARWPSWRADGEPEPTAALLAEAEFQPGTQQEAPARWMADEPAMPDAAPVVPARDHPLERVDWSASALDVPATALAAAAPDLDVGEPLPGTRAEPPPKAKKKKGGKNALPPRLVPVFTRELQVLLAAGLPMDRALRIVVEATADDRVAAAADALLARVRSGSLLSEAMEELPDRFDEFLRMAVRAGEAGGALPVVLDQVATYQERGQRLARSVRTALIYPSILAFAAALSVILLLTVVVPQFETLFRQSAQAPPLATRLVIGASIFLRDYGWILPATVAFLWIALRWRYADARRGLFLHRRALRLPLVGNVIAGVSVERFARALGTLLANGVALPDALGLVANAVPNRAIGAVIASAVDRVKQGERLGDTLEEGGAMPLLAVQLVRVGEESGRLVEMLDRLADIYAQEVDTAVRRLTSMIEPILILVIGVVVGGIVLSLLSAIAGLNALAL